MTEQQRLDALADAVAAGAITVAEWLTAMQAELTANGATDAQQRDLEAYATTLAQQPTIDATAVKAHVAAYLPQTQPNALPEALSVVGSTLSVFAALAQKERSGSPVDVPTIDSAVFEKYADHFRSQVDTLAEKLTDGTITPDEWHTAMQQEVGQAHMTAYVIGKGGADQLDTQDFAAINAKVDEQLDYLDQWAAQMASGEGQSAEYIANRAKLYLGAANASLQRGTTEAYGMPELPAYPADGTTECRTNDRCQWEITKLPGDGNWDAYWRLNPAEHCETCLTRAAIWNPLRIRGGQIEDYQDDPRLFAD